MSQISIEGIIVYQLIKNDIATTEKIKRYCWNLYSRKPADIADALAELSNAGLIRYQEAGELWIVE